MDNKIKVTFKKYPKVTGLAGIGYSKRSVEMFIHKKKFGIIHAPTWQTPGHKWNIMITIIKENILEDGNENSIWRWINFKQRFDDELQAREWIKENIENINKRYKLYFTDSDIE